MNNNLIFGAYTNLKNLFWADSFWLPPNVTWSVLDRNGTVYFPHSNDLWYPIPLALFLLLVRLIWERFVAHPIGRMYNLKDTPNKAPIPNPTLESIFKKNKKIFPDHKTLLKLEEELKMTRRSMEIWWKRRRVVNKPSEMQRFRETSWRFLFYVAAFWGGLFVLWDKPWTWDTDFCWKGYPTQQVDNDIWYYYMVEMAFYWSLVFSLFMDNLRKDFKEMIIHHIVTITLLAMSYSANFLRIGSLIMCIHDAVDWIMEGAKLTNYCKYSKLTDAIFVVFTIVWFLTRICLYPIYILKPALFDATKYTGMANIYYLYNGLMCTLQVLHFFWFYTILKMVYYYVIKGQVEKDERSDTEPDSESEEEKEKNKRKETSENVLKVNGINQINKKKFNNAKNHLLNNNNNNIDNNNNNEINNNTNQETSHHEKYL